MTHARWSPLGLLLLMLAPGAFAKESEAPRAAEVIARGELDARLGLVLSDRPGQPGHARAMGCDRVIVRAGEQWVVRPSEDPPGGA